jgi:hypothetical protein
VEAVIDGGRLVVSMDVAKSPSGMYGITGDFVVNQRAIKGIAVSKDAGKRFQVYPTDQAMQTDAYIRYSAFPSDEVWYVACGTWGSSSADDTTTTTTTTVSGVGQRRELTSRIFIDETTHTVGFRNESVASAQGLAGIGYAAEILKTTDGGASFASVFQQVDQGFYFNGIHCASDDVCMVVAEGGNGQDEAGSIWGTKNGGATWEKLMQDPEGGPGTGLFHVRMVSELEAWAVGGDLASRNFEARFFHTTDGGASVISLSLIAHSYLDDENMFFLYLPLSGSRKRYLGCMPTPLPCPAAEWVTRLHLRSTARRPSWRSGSKLSVRSSYLESRHVCSCGMHRTVQTTILLLKEVHISSNVAQTTSR